MNRRQYIRFVAIVPMASLTAGCTDGGGSPDQTETVVVAVGDGDGGGGPPPLTETDSSAIEIDATEFERTGDNEFVVDGAVRNVGDQAFAHLELEVRLYEAGSEEEGFFDEAERQREFEYLAATETWTWRLHFNDVEIEDVSHYSVTATATMATPTP